MLKQKYCLLIIVFSKSQQYNTITFSPTLTGDIDSFISSALWTPFNFARQLVFSCYSLTLTNSNRPSQLGTQSTWTDHFLFLILPTRPHLTWPIGSTHASAPLRSAHMAPSTWLSPLWMSSHGSAHFSRPAHCVNPVATPPFVPSPILGSLGLAHLARSIWFGPLSFIRLVRPLDVESQNTHPQLSIYLEPTTSEHSHLPLKRNFYRCTASSQTSSQSVLQSKPQSLPQPVGFQPTWLDTLGSAHLVRLASLSSAHLACPLALFFDSNGVARFR